MNYTLSNVNMFYIEQYQSDFVHKTQWML